MPSASPVATYSLVVLGHAIAAAGVYHFAPGWARLACVLAPLVPACLLLHAFYRFVKKRAESAAAAFHARFMGICALLDGLADMAQQQRERDLTRCMEDYIARTSAIDDDTRARVAEVEDERAEARRILARRGAQSERDLAHRKKAALADLDAACGDMAAKPKAQYDARVKQHQSSYGTRKMALDAERSQTLEALASEWEDALREFREFTEEAMKHCSRSHPEWSGPSWQAWEMPAAFPDAVFAGKIHLDLGALAPTRGLSGRFSLPADRAVTLPAALGFPDCGSLLMSVGSSARTRGLEALLDVILRLLTSFPPGKAKLTILDPVGLGQSFSALMHLADYDESLVGGRIWAEPTHIERRLAELTEHIEKVIQKYLRGRYASIDAYNREAGEMAEAYRFLAIADFPTGLSALALDRLASIITSGARCGVYTLILHDRKQAIPAALDAECLKANGLTIVEQGDGLVVADEAMKQPRFEPETPPAVHEITALLQSIGEQAQTASRIEVRFDMVAPREGEYWSGSTEAGIRVPIGRAGADRSQYLDVGQGTAQHVLVSGKTGSGKSTLFHVLITNLSLWFSPDELQLYLVDFKQGVEFKRFATAGLPHARVIAIESDREFGLSVLERIDREFAHRAELFRQSGVQDLASYRRETRKPLPRLLLIIDEFQEFFTEDDAVAQQAALLLDRIVRQGRAFGVHVVLGSQTLGGAYTLARSTMGQMAVRIALQCNEADSYLILGEDNAAGRLLSRPGEAIYNDLSGLVEGNSPFQVVWLPDADQMAHLRAIREKAEQENWTPQEPAIVFEGNVPAELGRNARLQQLLAHPAECADGASDRLWLGEASTIKGPTEAVFTRRSGSNLLMVGHRADSALGIVAAAVFSLCAHHDGDGARIVILDGSSPDSDQRGYLRDLAAAVPHAVKLVEHREVPQAVEELADAVKARQAGAGGEQDRVFVIVFGLQRLRMLRQEEDFGFSVDEDEKPTPDKCFATILTDGPEHGVHTIVWCDSLTNLNRALNRKTLHEFEMRVLFQMSPTDSAELTDTPLASKLGLYKALLFIEADGITETFRPYGIPTPEVMARLRELLAGRQS